MNILSINHILMSLIKYYMFGHRTPIAVSYLSTYTCNQKCKYCDWKSLDHSELTTQEAQKLIRSMKKSGVVKLGFAGGESLNRKDIKILLKTAHEVGLITSISSNGKAIKDHIEEIKKYVNVVQISLDGPEVVHDNLRGEGSHRIVLDAIKLLKENNIKIITNTVLTKKNISELPYILNFAKETNHLALFQPIFNYYISESDCVINSLVPAYFEMYYAIEYLIKEKKAKGNVGNSIDFLKYVQNTWNVPRGIKCHANNLFCAVDPKGYIVPCCFDSSRNEYASVTEHGFQKAFMNSIENRFANQCEGCYCNAYIESNFAFSFRLEACLNALLII